MYGGVPTLKKSASSLTDMPLWTNSSAKMPQAGRPQGLCGFARVALVAAWAVFWLGTAIFPCCESIAALVAGDHSDEVAHSDSAAPHVHQSDDAHADGPDHDPAAPCEHSLAAGPVLVAEPGVLTSDRTFFQWLTVEEIFSIVPTVVAHRPSLALPHAAPPPQPRFHLRTQRLLI